MRTALIALAAALAAAPAIAQQPGVAAPEAAAAGPQRPVEEVPVNQQIVFGEDPCAPRTDEEITICVRLPEDERFRIPTNLRQNPNDPANQAWANRAIELSYVGAAGIGSCSPTGSGGFVGCFNQLANQARAERQNSDQVNWNQLIEQARQERLRRIDEEIMSEEPRGPEPQ